jgi:hypothetical protein
MQKIDGQFPDCAELSDEDAELRRLAEEFLGGEIFDFEFAKAKEYAERKLFDWIIPREGDLDGERREPWYLAKLIEEAVRASRLSEYCEFRYTERQKAVATV